MLCPSVACQTKRGKDIKLSQKRQRFYRQAIPVQPCLHLSTLAAHKIAVNAQFSQALMQIVCLLLTSPPTAFRIYVQYSNFFHWRYLYHIPGQNFCIIDSHDSHLENPASEYTSSQTCVLPSVLLTAYSHEEHAPERHTVSSF